MGKTVNLTATVTPETADAVDNAAKDQGQSRSEWLRAAIQSALDFLATPYPINKLEAAQGVRISQLERELEETKAKLAEYESLKNGVAPREKPVVVGRATDVVTRFKKKI